MTDSLSMWRLRLGSLLAAMSETVQIANEVKKERSADIEAKVNKQQLNRQEENRLYEPLLETTQIKLCHGLLDSLLTFTDDAGDFFLTRFFGEQETLLDEAEQFRHRFIMRTIFYQASRDLSIIQHAINQRRHLDGKPTLLSLGLALADRVATLAVHPLIRAGYLPDSTNVICYLDKNVRARLVPYDDTLLISIASDSLQYATSDARHNPHTAPEIIAPNGPSRNLIVLLHEIGHHLYWNGRIPNTNTFIYQALHQKAKDLGITHPREWRLRWLEEIFADAYALMQGGPAVVLDFQEMLTDDLPDHFSEDTDKHPIPEIRPLLQTNFLRKIRNIDGSPTYTQMPDRLDANWHALIGQDAETRSYRVHSRKPAPGTDILQALDSILEIVLDVLKPLSPHSANVGPWSTDSAPEHNLGELYAQFAAVAGPQPDDLFVAYFFDELTDPAVKALYDKKFSTTPKTFVQRVEELTGTTPANAPNDDWIDTFLSQGWSTEGPESGGGWKG
ncbi:MAG: hypothetical protein KC419_11635 [Anaerolineales bacterium]|nr:hypothetical protein [Anaerolineales bacterium]